jgi:hypothetical protein
MFSSLLGENYTCAYPVIGKEEEKEKEEKKT